MVELEKIITMQNAAMQIGISMPAFIRLVEEGLFTPYIVRLQKPCNGGARYSCVEFFGSDGGKYPQRAFFHADCYREQYQPVVFDCREIQAYIDSMAAPIEETCVCSRPDPDYVPPWERQAAPQPWEKERRRGSPQDCATVAGWLEMERQGGRQADKKQMCIDLLTVGLEHLRGGTAEQAYYAAFGDGYGWTDADKKKEKKYRSWFIEYARKKGHDFSWLDNLSPL